MPPTNGLRRVNQYMTVAALTSHRGYLLKASAVPAQGGLHAAELVVEKLGDPPRTFSTLDYFFDREHALSYASSWGRIWVDMNS